MTIDELIQSFGLPVSMLIIALVTGMRGDWNWRRETEEIRKDRDEWKGRAIGLMTTADKAVSALEKKDGA